MSVSGEQAAGLDSITEATVHTAVEEEAKATPKISSIEATDEDEDSSAQIVYMLNNLPPVAKRRTLLQIQPLMSSTFTEATSKNAVMEEPRTTGTAAAVTTEIDTSKEDRKLEAGNSTIIVHERRNAMYPKLRIFSGISPLPQGQVNFSTWHNAATRLCSNTELSEADKLSLLQNSIMQPALDFVQTALDSQSSGEVLRLLSNAYGSVDDPRDLMNDFHATTMTQKEKASDFLNRLYLKLEALKRMNIVNQNQGAAFLLRQFNYGCSDDTLLLKLRLEEKEDNPPEFGSLLLSIRKEEAKQVKKKSLRSAQVTSHSLTVEKSSVESKEVSMLKEEIASLKLQLAKKESAKPSQANSSDKSNKDRKGSTRKKFCFKCGQEGHLIWKCQNPPNAKLVNEKFEEMKEN